MKSKTEKLPIIKIEVEVDFEKDQTKINSPLPVGQSLSILMEGVGVLTVQLINEGMEAKKAYDLVYDYLEKTIKHYAIRGETKKGVN